MFKITPIQDELTHKEICRLCGVEYRAGYFAYLMFDIESGAPMGMSQFEIRGEDGYISAIKEAPGRTDTEAMFILGRQTMNFIDLCGAHLCYADENTADNKLLSAIGFKRLTDGAYFCNMTGMFDGHCDGHAVNLDK